MANTCRYAISDELERYGFGIRAMEKLRSVQAAVLLPKRPSSIAGNAAQSSRRITCFKAIRSKAAIVRYAIRLCLRKCNFVQSAVHD